jgi:predicted GNAT family N-acyltransferase
VASGGFRYEQLGDHHLPLRRHFRCGQEALDIYLRSRQAWKEQEDDLAAVRVIYDPMRNRIAGYYTLSGHSIQRVLLPEETTRGRTRYEHFPATLLGRIARDVHYAGQRIGERLLLDALRRSLDASRLVASFAVVLDAKTPDVESFYQHFGFQRLDTDQAHERRYFLLMETIRQLFV